MEMEAAMDQQHTAAGFPDDTFPTPRNTRRLSTVTEEESGEPSKQAPRQTSSPEEDDDEDNPSAKRQRAGYACLHCNMDFTEKRALARHKKTDHHRRQIGLPPDRRHACFVCGKHFTRGHDLKRHQNEQHPDAIPGGAVEVSSGGSEYSTEHGLPEEQHLDRSASAESNLELEPQRHSPTNTATGAMRAGFLGTSTGPWLGGLPLSTTAQSGMAYLSSSASEDLYQATSASAESNTSAFEADPSRYGRFNDASNIPSTGIVSTSTGPWLGGLPVPSTAHIGLPSPVSAVPDSQPIPALNSIPDLMETERTDSSEGSPDSCRSWSSDGSDTVKPLDDHTRVLPLLSPLTSARMMEMERYIPDYGRDIDSWQPLMCVMCGVAYEDDPEELVKHLKRHLDTSGGKYQCIECVIGFVHEEDLERHLQCAAEGHCGFSFQHTSPCTGHHPPRNEIPGGLSDYDRVRLFDRVQHWEQAQLQAYMFEIDELTTERRMRRVSRWSDVLRGSSRRNSQSSFAISVNTFASAPCDVTDGRYDVGGLQKRLQQMSLGDAKTRMRRLMRTGSTNPQDTLNKSLKKAVKHSDIHKAAQHLDVGADPSIVHEDEGPFVTLALWGHGYVAARMAEHRIDEDMSGRCQKCKTHSVNFDKAAKKVKALLLHGAEVDQPGGLCGYPLVTAAWMGKPDIVKLLLNRDVDINRQSHKYGTALCAAASQAGYPGHTKVIDMLIHHGADAHLRVLDGTPLELAKKRLDVWSASEDEDRVANCQKVVLALERAEAAPIEVLPNTKRKRLRNAASEPELNLYGYWRV